MTNDHPCIGAHCGLCDELHCPDRLIDFEGVAVCPVCAYRLGLTSRNILEAA